MHPNNVATLRLEWKVPSFKKGHFLFCDPSVQWWGGCDRALVRGPSIVWGLSSWKRVGFSAPVRGEQPPGTERQRRVRFSIRVLKASEREVQHILGSTGSSFWHQVETNYDEKAPSHHHDRDRFDTKSEVKWCRSLPWAQLLFHEGGIILLHVLLKQQGL